MSNLTTLPGTRISARQAKEDYLQELRCEEKYLSGVTKRNKGEAIPLSVKNILTAQKLSQNLRHYFNLTQRSFADTDTKEARELAQDFMNHWRKKLTDSGKDAHILEILDHPDALIGIELYIGAEILREKNKLGLIENPKVQYIVSVMDMNRENRNNFHEAVQKTFKDAARLIREEFQKHGFRLDGRQLAQIDAILSIHSQRAIQQVDEMGIAKFDQQQVQLLKLIEKSDAQLALEKIA